jgi:hypothetical protein
MHTDKKQKWKMLSKLPSMSESSGANNKPEVGTFYL